MWQASILPKIPKNSHMSAALQATDTYLLTAQMMWKLTTPQEDFTLAVSQDMRTALPQQPQKTSPIQPIFRVQIMLEVFSDTSMAVTQVFYPILTVEISQEAVITSVVWQDTLPQLTSIITTTP